MSTVGHEQISDLSTGYSEAVHMMKVDLETIKERLRMIEDRLSANVTSYPLKHEVSLTHPQLSYP